MSVPHLIFIGSFMGTGSRFTLELAWTALLASSVSEQGSHEGRSDLQAGLLRSQLPSGDVNSGNCPDWRQDVSQSLQQIPAAGVCLCSQTCCPNLPPVITVLGNFPALLSWANILSVALSKALVWTGALSHWNHLKLRLREAQRPFP